MHACMKKRACVWPLRVSTDAHWLSTRDTSTVTTAIVHAPDASRIVKFGSPHGSTLSRRFANKLGWLVPAAGARTSAPTQQLKIERLDFVVLCWTSGFLLPIVRASVVSLLYTHSRGATSIH
jgi:hypothetical protein